MSFIGYNESVLFLYIVTYLSLSNSWCYYHGLFEMYYPFTILAKATISAVGCSLSGGPKLMELKPNKSQKYIN